MISMLNELAVGLSAWIIMDGNYGEFQKGQRAAFALEFYNEAALRISEHRGDVFMRRESGSFYQARGRVTHISEDWWAMDFGIPAFQNVPPPKDVRPGTWLEGRVYIGIDPFFYFEQISHFDDAPDMIHDWIIEGIEMQTAPFVDAGENRMVRDPALSGWREIPETDAWNDDDGSAEYLLHCRRISVTPRRALATDS
ncbi:hypothetical protein [Rhizobium indicum]|uniref:Uncharacterized protein n=1 Tax=Rhizobium indicum TaxID=2583231 RepID=A0ABX6PGW3_9HYPH|nr:hypothetical protein [Rhizobium indicum]QKK17100.1 hypothetical protein FFM53_012010 [Rhizobium indicum]